MTGIVDWATQHARMIIAFVVLSIAAGTISYIGLPKEGEPDIDIPALFVSVPFPGISAEDSEKLIVQPLESKLRDLDGLKTLSAVASEGYAIAIIEFEFGWDKAATIADVRDRVNKAEAEWPDGAEQYSIDEINFSEFPVLVVSLSGDIPERTLLRVANDLQTEVESLGAVLSASLAGYRNEMLEVLIDPLQLEAYNVTASELINVVVNNNKLVAAGEVESGSGTFAVKIPSSFDEPQDVYNLPVKVNGDRVITLGELADIRLTFEDQYGTARFNGESTVALQVVKRKGENLIQTVAEVKEVVDNATASWPPELKESIRVSYSMDQSKNVEGMVSQLEASVLTAIALVMIVVLAALGIRSALLVGFAIPTSFLLCFAILAAAGMSITNIVMFGLILAVGMLVDGAIVVVEYADKRISAGDGPMHAYTAAAKRMFWPIVSSTATTLCAFLPMLFWPGVPGEFMGNLPVTLIFVLSASLVVALVYLPVVGGVAGRISRFLTERADALYYSWHWVFRLALLVAAVALMFNAVMMLIRGGEMPITVLAAALFVFSCLLLSVAGGSLRRRKMPPIPKAGYRRTLFGYLISFITGNWRLPFLSWLPIPRLIPFLTVGLVVAFIIQVFTYFGENSKGVEFFVETEPEQAIIYVRARGNLSLSEKDRLVKSVEERLLDIDGIESIFSFAGAGGINQNTGGAQVPTDTIGQIQLELAPWDERRKGKEILAEIDEEIKGIPGIKAEIIQADIGPASGKPINIRLTGDNWDELILAAGQTNGLLQTMDTLVDVEDSRPLPGIDWQIDVDVEQAGRYGANVSTVGAMVQLVTRGILLDTMQVDTSDEEIEIRVRYPEQDRVLSTLDQMRVRTNDGLIPLSNFVERKPVPKLAQINRYETERQITIRAGVGDEINEQSQVDRVAAWLELQSDFPSLADAENWLDQTTQPEHPLYEKVSAWVAAFVAPENVTDPANPNPDALKEWITDDMAKSESEIRTALLDNLEVIGALPSSVDWEFAGDQQDQAESQAFLGQAFIGALGLMFVILLAQFNSLYNSVVVLLAVIMSVTGVLIGMLVMDQTFSIIMTGTGVVALAGIVVNNNIVLIDTYQEYARYMPRIEAITRTAEARIRPVLLTTITTMAGLTPMMFGISVDFFNGGYTIDAPTALWWKQLATAVVFGLGLATILTLVVTPALLSARVWVTEFLVWLLGVYQHVRHGRDAPSVADRRMRKEASKKNLSEIVWSDPFARATQWKAAPPRPAADHAAE